MAITSFIGRVIFVLVLLLSAWHELVSYWERSSRVPCWTEDIQYSYLKSRFSSFQNGFYDYMVESHRFNEFGSDGGPTTMSLDLKINLYSKYRMQLPDIDAKHIVVAAIVLMVLGSLLFVIGSSFGAHLLVLHRLLFPVMLYDFYNYDTNEKEFAQLLVKFTENLAMLGAFCFFIGMKNSMPRRLKKKDPKTKKN